MYPIRTFFRHQIQRASRSGIWDMEYGQPIWHHRVYMCIVWERYKSARKTHKNGMKAALLASKDQRDSDLGNESRTSLPNTREF